MDRQGRGSSSEGPFIPKQPYEPEPDRPAQRVGHAKAPEPSTMHWKHPVAGFVPERGGLCSAKREGLRRQRAEETRPHGVMA